MRIQFLETPVDVFLNDLKDPKSHVRKLCGHGFGSKSFWDGLSCDRVVTAHENDSFLGYTLISNNNNFIWHIELMCGKGTGILQMEFVKQEAARAKVAYLTLSSLYDKVSYYVVKHGFTADFILDEEHSPRICAVQDTIVDLWTEYKRSVLTVQEQLNTSQTISIEAVCFINDYDTRLRQLYARLASYGCSYAEDQGDERPDLRKNQSQRKIDQAWFDFACDGVLMTYSLWYPKRRSKRAKTTISNA